jgi:hypothetical protein
MLTNVRALTAREHSNYQAASGGQTYRAAVFSGVCFAASNSDQAAQLNTLTQKYGLKHVTIVPTGVTPIKFDTVAQADAFLSAVQHESSLGSSRVLSLPKPDASQSASVKPDADAYGTQTYSVYDYFPAGYNNLQIWYYYYYSSQQGRNLFDSLSSIASYISGFESGITWQQNSTYGYVYNNGLNIYAQASGVLTYWLLIDGGIQIYQQPATWSHTFSNP